MGFNGQESYPADLRKCHEHVSVYPFIYSSNTYFSQEDTCFIFIIRNKRDNLTVDGRAFLPSYERTGT
jgi:hypothetical protein